MMAEVRDGILTFVNGQAMVSFLSKKGVMTAPTRVANGQLDVELAKLAGQPGEIAVELELESGQPWHVCPKGKDRQRFSSHQPIVSSIPQRTGSNNRPPLLQNNRPTPQAAAPVVGEFHNPYNFIPAPPRNTSHTDLGDHEPVGHDCYCEGHWSGRITVRMVTETPLLLVDAANLREDQTTKHKTYPVRRGPNGDPLIAPTGIKGMLRAAFEAVTNSRMGVFASHNDRLAYRMKTDEALRLIPARVEGNGTRLRFFFGTSPHQATGIPVPEDCLKAKKPLGRMYAAWVSISKLANYAHQDHVWALIEEDVHWDKKKERYDFQYWKVLDLNHDKSQLPRAAGKSQRHVQGYLCITNKNFGRKHDERLFFYDSSPNTDTATIDATLVKSWENLIRNYQEIHEEERKQGAQRPPALPSDCVWSRHIVNGKEERRLTDDTLCYAEIATLDTKITVKALYPVMISRQLFSCSPEELLEDSLAQLLPPSDYPEFSPADRVFGWVRQQGNGAYRGQLRVGSVAYDPVASVPERPIADFPTECHDTLPLAILGQPKPQQVRFYCAEDRTGNPLEGTHTKQEGFVSGRYLRGRKIYPHHGGLPTGYWANPTEDRTHSHPVEGRFQEYRRRPFRKNVHDTAFIEKDSQNRSVEGWIKPQVHFTFTIDVVNLSTVELGALLWLLSLKEDTQAPAFHRLGGGKPLGLGSVRLWIEDTQLWRGEDWQQYFSTLLPIEPPVFEQDTAIRAFKKAVCKAYPGESFSQVPFIAAFLQAARGFHDKPIHYPRTRPTGCEGPVPLAEKGENFKWFSENERTNNRPVSLGALTDDSGLPYFQEREQHGGWRR
ncbi:MAG TPA: TIGR03986 family CRISPR-associated RAMP protein [Armatimonadota bacterium]|jgi:CRISPR-associated protein (TIGR03986 family)